MICPNITALSNAKPDICVIGAGPVGISLALELSRRGKTVLLLESGGTAVRADLQKLSDANIVDLRLHVPMDLAVQRRLGGASNLWGGRCVPMDALDFESRAILDLPAWPITAADLEPFLPLACDYLGCGNAIFESSIRGLNTSRPDFRFDRLERWSLRPNLRIAYLSELRESRNLTLCLLATAVGFEFDRDGFVRLVKLRGPENAYAEVKPRHIVVAAGGLENTRLLLAAQQEAPRRFGGPDGPLGRYYMGHLDGSLAQIVIHSPALDEGLDYYNDETGSCVRRRFWPTPELQRRLGLTNVTIRPEFPPIHEPSHGNGVLSLAYLGLSVPALGRLVVPETIRQRYMGGGGVQRAPHLRNIARDLPHVLTFFPRYVYRRYITHSRAHSFFERCPGRRYALRYHAEHLPHRNSRVTLSGKRDAFGLPRLSVDFRFTSADAEPLIRTHECLADWLAATGLGTLYWSAPAEERIAHILDQSKDGQHQIGTTRMGLTEQTGVVDKDCCVFGVPNLFVAGTSTFCSSGQANPTLTAVALAMRLAHKLSRRDTVREFESEGINGAAGQPLTRA
jgi:GMC oxidoreductase/FAD dependent oxidoreductase